MGELPLLVARGLHKHPHRHCERSDRRQRAERLLIKSRLAIGEVAPPMRSNLFGAAAIALAMAAAKAYTGSSPTSNQNHRRRRLRDNGAPACNRSMTLSPDNYRSKAAECGERARQSKSLKDIRHFRRLKQSYLALAANEAWLAGEVPPQGGGLAQGSDQ
jgi:hypothetical protein